jgi:predicted component of type VI protein secretion system
MQHISEIQQLINATETLINCNNRLTEINAKAFEFIKEQIIEEKETRNYLQEEYKALSDKHERSIQEEVQYL